MPISADLLAILVCPQDKQPLKLAGPDLVAALNDRIAQHVVKNRGGTVVADLVEGLLVRSDNKVAYPIRSGIPVLLIDEGILLEGE